MSDFPEFLQRMKFYAFYRLNTLVKKGKFKFENLSKIYCIGILGTNIFDFFDYYNLGRISNENGEIMDEQMVYITVELAKFNKVESEISTDLDKLIYTMKNLHKIQDEVQFPVFWNEEWLKKAIEEVDTRRMTAEQLYHYNVILAQNAEAIRQADLRELALKRKLVEKMLADKQLSVEKIAEYSDTSIEFVNEIKRS